MTKLFIHIGYPKCLSTTLQRYYFEKNPAIWYGGIGINDNISYIDEETEFFFEVLLKYSRDEFYDGHKKNIKKHFDELLENKNISVFSSEHISMNFTLQGLQFDSKIRRLNDVFSEYRPEIIMIHRDKESLIESLYKEMVKMGYYKSLSDFKDWVLRFQDRNFYYDLDVSEKINYLKKHFEKVHVLKFEELLSGDLEKNINEKLSTVLGIENQHLNIGNSNPSLTDNEVKALREINYKMKREIGDDMLEPFEHMRNRSLFKKIGLELNNDEIFKNVIEKRKALSYLKTSNS